MAIFNGLIFRKSDPVEPTCFHGIRQTTKVACECACTELELLGLDQDTGGGNVVLSSGEFRVQTTDLEIPGRGFNWKFDRTYYSANIFDGPLGHGWDFNYNRRLAINVQGRLFRMDGYGRADEYAQDEAGFRSPSGYYTRLLRASDGTFTEVDRNRSQVTYSPLNVDGIARMVELKDRHGNLLRFDYNSQDQLVQATDTLGRLILYRFDENGRLSVVEDFLGRLIRFSYAPTGDLETVTLPAVNGTPTGNDFPDGIPTEYHYSQGFSEGRLNHNLAEIIAPNEVLTQGPARVRVQYETDPGVSGEFPHAGRVVSQTIGGTNASGIPAGGTIAYAYDFRQTTVTDRNGNQTVYRFDDVGHITRVGEVNNRRIRVGFEQTFDTVLEYNRDGEVTRLERAQGNATEYTYDTDNPDRLQQGNLLTRKYLPDFGRGVDQQFVLTTYAYDPLYNQTIAVVEARGNDPQFAPANGGPQTEARYTTRALLDYQEGADFSGLAVRLGLAEAEVRRLLDSAGVLMDQGDLNDDGDVTLLAGDVVKVIYPAVHLLADSIVAGLENSNTQQIEETYAYNRFGQLTRYRDAEGNVTLYAYHPENDPDGDGRDPTLGMDNRPFGYLKEVTKDAEAHPARDSNTNPDPVRARHRYFYDRAGNITTYIDPRGVATRYLVNERNQVVRQIRAAEVEQALHNPHEPRWADCSDQALPECSRGMIAFKYKTDYLYDANGNLTKRVTENRDSNNLDLLGDAVAEEHLYDLLDQLLQVAQEVSQTPEVRIERRFRYDRNGNRVLETSPVANLPDGDPDQQPSNVISWVYDERDLPFTKSTAGLTTQFRSLAANADLAEQLKLPSSKQLSTVSTAYDSNRNLIEATEVASRAHPKPEHTTSYRYDGFDRLMSVVDAVGNQLFYNYDPAGNRVRVSSFGPLGGPTPTDNSAATLRQPFKLGSLTQPLLAQMEAKHDELGRVFEENTMLATYKDVRYIRKPVLDDGPLGEADDGLVTTRYEYDRKSRPIARLHDDLGVERLSYDGLHRVIRRRDAEGNTVDFRYDDNGNMVSTVEVDVTRPASVNAGSLPDLQETFRTIRLFDSLNRLIRTTDNLGQSQRHTYDSRDNLILTSDAQHSQDPSDLIDDPLGLFGRSPGVAKINRPGNTTEFLYDGLRRRIAEIRTLRSQGQGKNSIDTTNPANSDGLIVLDYQWDANGRLVAVADDGSSRANQNTSIGAIEAANPLGNVTRYRYDELNRVTAIEFADGSIQGYVFGAFLDDLAQTIDANGSRINLTYDGIQQLVGVSVSRAKSDDPHPLNGFKDPAVSWQVIGTTSQSFLYDGLGRLVSSRDDESDLEGNDIQNEVGFAYDSMGRIVEEVQNERVVSTRWDGVGNRVGLVYPNGRTLNSSFDGLGNATLIRDEGEEKPIAQYDYIGAQRVLRRRYQNGVELSFVDGQPSRDTGYDGLRRILHVRHAQPDGTDVVSFQYDYDRVNNKLAETSTDGIPSQQYGYDSAYRLVQFSHENSVDSWQLDGANNWSSRGDNVNVVDSMNQYVAFGGVRQQYDANGNLIDDGKNLYQYDAFNRLRTVTRKSDSAVLANHSYDAHHRRVAQLLSSPDEAITLVFCTYDGWQAIEELTQTSRRQFVFGSTFDAPIIVDSMTDGTAPPSGRFFYHEDGRSNVRAVTSTDGALAERYAYDAYGAPTVIGTDGGPRPASVIGNNLLFSSRPFHSESGLYYFRMRDFNPRTGRFVQRDPSGSWHDANNAGNGYCYVGNNPVCHTDPTGLVDEDPPPNVEPPDGGGDWDNGVGDDGATGTEETYTIWGEQDPPARPPVWRPQDPGGGGGVGSGSFRGSGPTSSPPQGAHPPQQRTPNLCAHCASELARDRTDCLYTARAAVRSLVWGTVGGLVAGCATGVVTTLVATALATTLFPPGLLISCAVWGARGALAGFGLGGTLGVIPLQDCAQKANRHYQGCQSACAQ
jgi:RHS repeat-associated protein